MSKSTKLYYSHIDSPVGKLRVVATSNGISGVYFTDDVPEISENNFIEECKKQLEEYFNGKRKNFDVKIDIQTSGINEKVWKYLSDIPFGQTKSYKDIAKLCGNENASRAVGSACGKNPVCIIIPCHRVIGSNKKLTGYAGGISRKEWLLKHEKSL